MSSSHATALIERYNELQREYRSAQESIARIQRHSEQLRQQMGDCISLSESVFGIKLSDHVDLGAYLPLRRAGSPTIKELVLEAVEQASPKPIRTAEIQARLRDMGYRVHPKTVGMNLFRWSQEGRVRCEGRHWYLVAQKDGPPDRAAQGESHCAA